MNCLLHGERGSGKTSLVRRVMYLEGQHQLGDKSFVIVNGAGHATPADLLGAVVEATRSTLAQPTDGDRDLMQQLRSWAGQTLRRVSPVIVVDDPDPVVAHNVLGPLPETTSGSSRCRGW